VPKEQCEMVLGADTLLHQLYSFSKGEDVSLKYSNREIMTPCGRGIKDYDICIERIAGSENDEGAWYQLTEVVYSDFAAMDFEWEYYPNLGNENLGALWLPSRMKYLFLGKLPKFIWIKLINDKKL
jgi:hypothetical protein